MNIYCKKRIFVEYTDDESKLFQIVQRYEKDSYMFIMSGVGKYKRKVWEFQKEYRYRIMVFPTGLTKFDPNFADLYTKTSINNILNNVDLPINYIDLEIDSNAFKDMEIILGPNTSVSDKIIVDLLVEKYNPDAKVKYSELRNKVLFK